MWVVFFALGFLWFRSCGLGWFCALDFSVFEGFHAKLFLSVVCGSGFGVGSLNESA